RRRRCCARRRLAGPDPVAESGADRDREHRERGPDAAERPRFHRGRRFGDVHDAAIVTCTNCPLKRDLNYAIPLSGPRISRFTWRATWLRCGPRSMEASIMDSHESL